MNRDGRTMCLLAALGRERNYVMDYESLNYQSPRDALIALLGPIEAMEEADALVFGAAMGAQLLCGTDRIAALNSEDFTEEQFEWSEMLGEEIPCRRRSKLDMSCPIQVGGQTWFSNVVWVNVYQDGARRIIRFHLEADGGPPSLYFISEPVTGELA